MAPSEAANGMKPGSASDAARVFRSPRWAVVSVVASALVFLVVAGVSWRVRGMDGVTVLLLGLVLLGIAGVLDILTQRIELHREHIVLVQNLRRREYPRNLFVKAQWGKGVPVSLQTADGRWVHLPGVGPTAQGLVNTLRAWLDA
jgi:hypothetical protein